MKSRVLATHYTEIDNKQLDIQCVLIIQNGYKVKDFFLAQTFAMLDDVKRSTSL